MTNAKQQPRRKGRGTNFFSRVKGSMGISKKVEQEGYESLEDQLEVK